MRIFARDFEGGALVPHLQTNPLTHFDVYSSQMPTKTGSDRLDMPAERTKMLAAGVSIAYDEIVWSPAKPLAVPDLPQFPPTNSRTF
jgi:hypothetical protein